MRWRSASALNIRSKSAACAGDSVERTSGLKHSINEDFDILQTLATNRENG